jgi:hypothetical protein
MGLRRHAVCITDNDAALTLVLLFFVADAHRRRIAEERASCAGQNSAIEFSPWS